MARVVPAGWSQMESSCSGAASATQAAKAARSAKPTASKASSSESGASTVARPFRMRAEARTRRQRGIEPRVKVMDDLGQAEPVARREDMKPDSTDRPGRLLGEEDDLATGRGTRLAVCARGVHRKSLFGCAAAGPDPCKRASQPERRRRCRRPDQVRARSCSAPIQFEWSRGPEPRCLSTRTERTRDCGRGARDGSTGRAHRSAEKRRRDSGALRGRRYA